MLLLALALRLKGIHDPLLDHPGWRQGDTASIAKNFAALQYNVFFPQTNYDGPPPNYVELELQILPIIAATFYKVVGVHEVIGRLISIAFSLGSVALLALFARWLFASEIAGICAGLLFAVAPGSVYYGRTFMPDTVMVFFLIAALFAVAHLMLDPARWRAPALAGACALLTLAFLAKPVSLTILVPVLALIVVRARARFPITWPSAALLVLLPLALLAGYEHVVASHAEWHWASGITRLHVIPAFAASLHGGAALHLKLARFRDVLGLFAQRMIGPAICAIALLGFVLPPASTRSRVLLWSWLIGGLCYVFAVVTVERVDYYMYLLVPLAALTGAGFLLRLWDAITRSGIAPLRYVAVAVGLLALAGVTEQNRRIVAPYYHYSKAVYRDARMLNATLPPHALVVMGHYDPAILYYIGRYGWEEDPYVWTPFDEESAIRKGARYFIDIERNRFAKNVELCAWMQRFPVIDARARWPVYVTDPARVAPGAQARWQAFRTAERAGHARAWLAANEPRCAAGQGARALIKHTGV